jgi:hypothetical protein
MIVRVELITSYRHRVAFVAIPRLPEPPSVILWRDGDGSLRAFHRYAAASSARGLADGDIYREVSVVTGETVNGER